MMNESPNLCRSGFDERTRAGSKPLYFKWAQAGSINNVSSIYNSSNFAAPAVPGGAKRRSSKRNKNVLYKSSIFIQPA